MTERCQEWFCCPHITTVVEFSVSGRKSKPLYPLAIAWAAGAYTTIESNAFSDSSGNGSLSPDEDGTLRVIFANLGVGQKTHALAVRVSSSDSRITITGGGNITITLLAVMARAIKTISLRGGKIPKSGTAILKFEYLEAGAVMRTETLTISVEPSVES